MPKRAGNAKVTIQGIVMLGHRATVTLSISLVTRGVLSAIFSARVWSRNAGGSEQVPLGGCYYKRYYKVRVLA
jgi:hypothetical protein